MKYFAQGILFVLKQGRNLMFITSQAFLNEFAAYIEVIADSIFLTFVNES